MSIIKENGEVDWKKLTEHASRRDEVHHQDYMTWLAGDEGVKARILMERLVEEVDEHVGMVLCNYVKDEDDPGSAITMDDMIKLSDELCAIYQKFAGLKFENKFIKTMKMRRGG